MSYTTTLASIAALVESIPDSSDRRIELEETPAQQATRLAQTRVAFAGRLAAVADQTALLALNAAVAPNRTAASRASPTRPASSRSWRRR